MTADWARLPYGRARAALQPDHQRGARRQPGGLRHHLEAARHHRVGVSERGQGTRLPAPGQSAPGCRVSPGGRACRRSGRPARPGRGRSSPSSAGSQRAPLSAAGPSSQPSSTVMRPPATAKTRPVTSFDSALPSQTTSGAMLSAASSSNASAGRSAARWPIPRFSVMRVSATGETAVDRHAVAGELHAGDDGEGGDAGLGRAVVGLPGVAEHARRRGGVDDAGVVALAAL